MANSLPGFFAASRPTLPAPLRSSQRVHSTWAGPLGCRCDPKDTRLPTDTRLPDEAAIVHDPAARSSHSIPQINHLDPAIFLTPLYGRIARNRMRLTESLRHHAVFLDSGMIGEVTD